MDEAAPPTRNLGSGDSGVLAFLATAGLGSYRCSPGASPGGSGESRCGGNRELHPGSLSSARPMFPRPHLSPRPLSAARPGRLHCRGAQTAVRPPLFHWEEHTVEGHCLNRFVVLSFRASQPQWVYTEKELLQSCRQTFST